ALFEHDAVADAFDGPGTRVGRKLGVIVVEAPGFGIDAIVGDRRTVHLNRNVSRRRWDGAAAGKDDTERDVDSERDRRSDEVLLPAPRANVKRGLQAHAASAAGEVRGRRRAPRRARSPSSDR